LIEKYFKDRTAHKRILWLIALLIILVAYGQRHWLLQSRAFDNDEFEHLHSAWLISKGQLPYLDYFEHHTPTMHFLLAQVYKVYQVEADFNEAKSAIVFSRRLMWAFTGIILILTFYLGRIWENWRIGLVGTVFLVGTLMFQEKTLEIRPDLLSLPCWLGCLILLMQVIQGKGMSEVRKRWFMAFCGFLLGGSIMTTQKMLFAMPGFTLAMFIYWFSPQSQGTVQQRFVQIICQLAGFFAPMVLMLGYFQLYNGAYTFIEYNLLLNLGWKAGFSPKEYILRLMDQNPFIVGFGLLGMIWAIYKSFTLGSFRRGDYIMVINLIGLLVGLFIIPVPWRQYYLIFLPLLALFSARFLTGVINDLIEIWSAKPVQLKAFMLKSGLFMLLSAFLLAWTFPEHLPVELNAVVKKFMLLALIGAGLIPVFLKSKDLTMALLIIAVHLPTAKKFKTKFNLNNQQQFESIQYVIENSPAESTFMDGWKGIGLYRQHAYFYWMLHEEIRGMLSEDQIHQLLEDLKSGKISPYFVNLDEDLLALSPEITAFFKEHYQPAGIADLYLRR
jgi:hypothetical protein